MRGREFIMKDGYSFHVDEADTQREYKKMYDTYARIFTRCGLAFRAVEADTGNIGGSSSHEFQVLTETGEDALVACDSCDYAANVEQAVARQVAGTPNPTQPVKKVATPGKHSIADVSGFFGVPPEKLVKTLIYLADGKPIAVMVRGDREVNKIKLAKALGVDTLALAGDAMVKEVTGASVGFAGPVGLKTPVPVYVDVEVAVLSDFIVGANEDDAHLTGVNIERDFKPAAVADYRTTAAGDACARCDKGHLVAYRGIEVGQVFFLGTKYSKPMGVTFLDKDGQEKPAVMGTYGIGVTRIVASAIEQNHDKDGIIWPVPLAPFEATVLALQHDDPAVVAAAQNLYEELSAAGIDVLFDDRDERPGVKFKDADLIGDPVPACHRQEGGRRGDRRAQASQRAARFRKLKIDEAGVKIVVAVNPERERK